MSNPMRNFLKSFFATSFAKEYVAKVFVIDGDPRSIYFTTVKPYPASATAEVNFEDPYGILAIPVGPGGFADEGWILRKGNAAHEVKAEEL